jgi:diguanylate cyclase (GGDEF)-like protein
MPNIKILYIEDDGIDQMAFKRSIKEAKLPYDYTIAGSLAEVKRLLETGKFDVIITDYMLGDGTGMEILNLKTDAPVIMVTGAGDEEIAVKAMKAGAYDYLTKDTGNKHLKALPLTIDKVLKLRRAEELGEKADAERNVWMKELEQRNREIMALSHMNNLLNSCATLEATYPVILRFAREFFPADAGALYVLNSSGNLLEAVSSWGESIHLQQSFAPKECMAVRLREIYSDQERPCKHLERLQHEWRLCMPFVARDDVIGMLHFQGIHPVHEKISEMKEYLNSSRQGLLMTFSEQTAVILSNIKLREELNFQATRDPLTGLFNRRSMMEKLELEINRAKRHQWPITILFLDIDHFKSFNDTHGHQAGDLVLKKLGEYLWKSCRGDDMPCRYGGEELLLIMPHCGTDVAIHAAERIRNGIKKLELIYQERSIGTIAVSIGVAIFPEHGSTGSEVLRRADEALYRAKAEGRDKVVVAGSP